MAILIHNVAELQAMNNDLFGEYELANDIDATETITWNGGAGFIPIGKEFNNFMGKFNGKGHKITNLYINATVPFVGLFGCVVGMLSGPLDRVIIRDVELVNPTVITACNQTLYCGALCGGSGYTWFINCRVTNGTIQADITSAPAGKTLTIGGLIGSTSLACKIVSCSAEASVEAIATGTNYNVYAGGLVGNVYDSSILPETCIMNCYSLGTISSDSSSSGCILGGLSGNISGCSTVYLCYSKTDIVNTYTDTLCGGFVGRFIASVADRCFSTGKLTGLGGGGGFVGWVTDDGAGHLSTVTNCFSRGDGLLEHSAGFVLMVTSGTIENCYSTGIGRINNPPFIYVTGFCFNNVGGTLTHCYWDIITSLCGMSIGGGTGLSTSLMKQQSSFTGWDFISIWELGAENDGYCYLRADVDMVNEMTLDAVVDELNDLDYTKILDLNKLGV